MKFKLSNKLRATSIVVGLVSAALLSFGSVASADQPACYQYNPNGFTTSQTPVFNDICGVPDNVNNESNFVRVRMDANGDDTDNTGNPGYTVGTLSATCQDGSKIDIWNYLHNDASSNFNDNGSGSAVAHNVQTSMTAPLGTTSSSFTFGDTVSASNAAASVSDKATVNCGASGQYKLSLVPGSVHVYSIPYNQWQNMSDSSINSTVKLGSPVIASGDMWGCWNYRIVVVYQVQLTKVVTPPQVTATCNLFTVTANSDRKVTVNAFKFTAENSTFKNAVINWGDQTPQATITDSNAVVNTAHTYASAGQYEISALVSFATANGTVTSGGPGSICSEKVTFSSNTNTPPVVTPPSTPTPTTPTVLPNTGAGSVVGIFAAVSAVAAVAHRLYSGRRLVRQ